MFSAGKLALLAAILVALMLVFRLVKGRKASKPENPEEIEVADTVRCRVCGAYVPKSGIGRCERQDCPF